MMRIHLSVGQRVTLGFLVIILLVVLASGVGLLYSRSVKTALDNAHNNSAQIEQIRSLQLQWTTVVALVDNLLLTRQTSLIESQLNPGLATFNQQLADLQKQNIGQNPAAIAKNQEIIKDLQQLGADLTNIANQIAEYTKTGSWAKAQTLRFTEMTSLQRRLNENLNQLSLNISKGIDEEIISSNTQQNSARTQLLSIIIFAVVMSAVLAYFTTRSITLPVAQLLNNVQRIMNRDFSHQEILQRDDEFGKLSQATSLMTDLLKETYEQLEQRVADRTRNLELAAEVGRTVSQVRALDIMLTDAAELIRKQFDLYYVQVYLTNPTQTALLLQAGTGTVGAELLKRAHQLPLSTSSINGRAAIDKHSVVIADTKSSAVFKPNPLLPDTRSEMAVPLLIGERVVGVLDIQSEQANSLNQGILPAFEALAGQLAIAIQNANLLAETEQARAEVEAQARRLVRSNWEEYMDAVHKPERTGFIFKQGHVVPMTETDEQQKVGNHAFVAPIAVTGEAFGSLIVELDENSSSARGTELTEAVARQVSQQVESLRLLETAERFRLEAEAASRRLTREGWKGYTQTHAEQTLGYYYDLKEVRPYREDERGQKEETTFTLPLKVRDETIGKLAVEGLAKEDGESINLVLAVAERLSAHIEGLRQFEETQRGQIELDKRAQQLAAVAEVSTVSSKELDIQKMLESVVFLTQRKFGLYHAHVFLYNENAQELQIAACGWKEGDEHEGTHGTTTISLQQEQSLVARAARTRTAVIVNDVRNEPGWLPNSQLPGTASELAVPLVSGDQILGVLDVQSDRINAFTEEDASIQTTLASQVATALQNARSFARAQQQAQRESALNVISQKIQSATTVEAVLQIAARELGHALGAPMTIAKLNKNKS